MEWKLAHFVINCIVATVMMIATSNGYLVLFFIQSMQFFIQLLNMKSGSWGSKSGWVYCNVDEQIREGQNSIRLISTAVTEAIIVAIMHGRFAAAAVLIMYRLDGVRRSYEKSDETEQAKIAKDLEALHAAQPTKEPIFGIDMIIPILFSLLWFNRPLLLLHFLTRSVVIVCRDVSIISPIQEELYSDVVTSFMLSAVIVFVVLLY